MNKRILSVICALAIVAGMIIPWTGDVYAVTTKCKCGATVTEWIALTDSTKVEPGKHYRLEWDVNRSTIGLYNKTGAAATTYCLDLNGYTLQGNSRVIVLNNSSDSQGAITLNIMDSSIEQTGKLMSPGVSDVYNGGAVYLYTNATVNLYGGTITTTDTSVVSASSGAVVNMWATATLNMSGGKIIGSTAAVSGGAIILPKNATLNMSGGTIVSGTAPKGKCVYAASGAVVKLSKNAKIEELYFENATAAASALTISGKYTGTTALNFTTAPAAGTQIGIGSNASVGLDSICISTPRLYGTVSDGKLLAIKLSGVAVKSGVKTTTYATLTEACANLKAGDTIKLLADNNENVTVSVDATLDLNGWDLTGNVNATGALKLKDSATDDFVADDIIGVGRVTGTLTGNVSAANNYMALADENGTSYHKYTLRLTNVSLRPGEAGVYYKANIKLNETVQERLDSFGIAVSVYDEEPTLDSAKTLYTSFGAEDYGKATAKSALIKDFMGTNDTAQNNTANAQTTVYGCPYIRYTDAAGAHDLYGAAYGTSLKDVTEQIVQKQSEDLRLDQNRALTNMYDTYYDTLKSWDLPYLHTARAKKQTATNDNSLKVLIIGNSHGLDSTHLLREVFKAEGYITEEQNVVLGALYIGGCRVSRHVSNLTQNAAEYDYYKNDGSNANGTWTIRATTTMQYALQDEDWDVVLLQEMNTASAFPEESSEFVYNNDNIETVYTYVVRNLGYEPELMWNMIWANPEIPEDYAAFAMKQNPGDDTYVEGIAPGSPEDPASDTWIFKDTMLGSRISWVHNYVNYWQNDNQTMYEGITKNLEDYILSNSALGFTEDDVMPGATAVQYALARCGMTEDGGTVTDGVAAPGMYRDYTHISDYARVMVAYLWYAKLTGKTEITDVNFTTVPYVLRATLKFRQLGDLELTDDQIQAIKDSVNFALKNPLAGDELMTLK